MLRRVLALGDQMKSRRVKRREFITLLGGAAAAWPLTAHAQQGERVRRVGVLVGLPADDDELQTRYAAFLQEFAELGWAVGRNLRIDTRWGASDIERIRKLATEIIALAPDVIMANGSSVVGPLHQMTRAVPIVFVNLTDPVSAGLVESLTRPGGNVTASPRSNMACLRNATGRHNIHNINDAVLRDCPGTVMPRCGQQARAARCRAQSRQSHRQPRQQSADRSAGLSTILDNCRSRALPLPCARQRLAALVCSH